MAILIVLGTIGAMFALMKIEMLENIIDKISIFLWGV